MRYIKRFVVNLGQKFRHAPYLLRNPKSKDSSLGKWQARVVQRAPFSRAAARLNDWHKSRRTDTLWHIATAARTEESGTRAAL
jgi:hypothetical protein